MPYDLSPDEQLRRIKFPLSDAIRRRIAALGPEAAAKRCDLSVGLCERVMEDGCQGFTLDNLIRHANALGLRVEFTVRQPS